jgi:glycosyltransferase involved in cell wall biosynthesis
MKVDVLLAVGYDPDVRVRRETQALAAAGYDVRILAWDRDGTRARREADGPVHIERVPIRSTLGRGVGQSTYFARLAWAYLRRVRRRRPDVLHAVDLPMLCIALMIAPLAGRPRIVYDAFELYAVMVSRRMPGPALRLIGWLERRLPHAADLVIAPGEIRTRYLHERGIASVPVPNWIDPPAHQPSREAARAELGLPSDRFVIAYAGALHPARDLDLLLDHAIRAPEDLVVIAGRGEDEERIAARAAGIDNVEVRGWLSDPTPLLAAVDALFYALRSDHPYAVWAAPNNLYAAIAHGVPLVYRRQGELAIVGDRHTIGERFSGADDLENAIDRLRDPIENERVRSSLRGLRDRYSWSRAAERLLAAYPKKGRAASSATANGP